MKSRWSDSEAKAFIDRYADKGVAEDLALLLIDPAGGLCSDPGACGPDLGWRCAHQTTAGVLDRIATS